MNTAQVSALIEKALPVTRSILLVGGPGIGKYHLLTKILAQVTKSEQVKTGNHPDLLILDGKKLKAEEVRVLKEWAMRAPIDLQYRIFLVRGADFVNPTCSALMLKVMEEGLIHNKWFLTAHRSDFVIDTIKSRSFIAHLNPLPQEEIESLLVARGKDMAGLRARWCNGDINLADRLDVETLQEWEVFFTRVFSKSVNADHLIWAVNESRQPNFDYQIPMVVAQTKLSLAVLNEPKWEPMVVKTQRMMFEIERATVNLLWFQEWLVGMVYALHGDPRGRKIKV